MSTLSSNLPRVWFYSKSGTLFDECAMRFWITAMNDHDDQWGKDAYSAQSNCDYPDGTLLQNVLQVMPIAPNPNVPNSPAFVLTWTVERWNNSKILSDQRVGFLPTLPNGKAWNPLGGDGLYVFFTNVPEQGETLATIYFTDSQDDFLFMETMVLAGGFTGRMKSANPIITGAGNGSTDTFMQPSAFNVQVFLHTIPQDITWATYEIDPQTRAYLPPMIGGARVNVVTESDNFKYDIDTTNEGGDEGALVAHL